MHLEKAPSEYLSDILGAVFAVSLLYFVGSIYKEAQTRPISNQEQALEEVAVYVEDISKLPPSEVRTEYLTTTKDMLQAGELTRGQLDEIKYSHYRLMTAASDGQRGELKRKLINDINDINEAL